MADVEKARRLRQRDRARDAEGAKARIKAAGAWIRARQDVEDVEEDFDEDEEPGLFDNYIAAFDDEEEEDVPVVGILTDSGFVPLPWTSREGQENEGMDGSSPAGRPATSQAPAEHGHPVGHSGRLDASTLARVARDLIARGWSQREVARTFGMARTTLQDYLVRAEANG